MNRKIENRAEVIFKNNINHNIVAEVISHDSRKYDECAKIFEGRLIDIHCNTFIIETNEGYREMFRYEDTINLGVENEIYKL